MTGHRAYRIRRLLAVLIVLGYTEAALLLKPAGEIERFPFFNWSLFSNSTNRASDVTLRIRSVDGQPVDPPQLFFDMKDTFLAAKGQDPRLPKLLDKLAHAVWTGDERTAEHLRSVVELTILKDVAAIQYDLVAIRYDPIERYRSGAVDGTTVLASYEKANP